MISMLYSFVDVFFSHKIQTQSKQLNSIIQFKIYICSLQKMNQANQPTYSILCDLAAERLCGEAFCYKTDFFSNEENLLKPVRGIFISDTYAEQVKCKLSWLIPAKCKPCPYNYSIKLAVNSNDRVVDTDTNRFSVSSADSCLKGGFDIIIVQEDDNLNEKIKWKNNLSQTLLQANIEYTFQTEIDSNDIFMQEPLTNLHNAGIIRIACEII
jgi:allantoicase